MCFLYVSREIRTGTIVIIPMIIPNILLLLHLRNKFSFFSPYLLFSGEGEGRCSTTFVLEGSSQGLTPYLFIYHFDGKGTHFLYLL